MNISRYLVIVMIALALTGCPKNGKNGDDGAQGPQGEQGETGPAGPQGENGAAGQDGLSASATSVNIGAGETLEDNIYSTATQVTITLPEEGRLVGYASLMLLGMTGSDRDVECQINGQPDGMGIQLGNEYRHSIVGLASVNFDTVSFHGASENLLPAGTYNFYLICKSLDSVQTSRSQLTIIASK